MSVLAPRQCHLVVVAVDQDTIARVCTALTHGVPLPHPLARFSQAPDSARVIVGKEVPILEIGELTAAVHMAANDGTPPDVRVREDRRFYVGGRCTQLLIVAQLALPTAPAIIFSWLDNVHFFASGLDKRG